MSWSDDIRCLYCDGRLALYRKITNGQFCSTAHRKAYWAEQERLAVERLHQTHDSLRAYRPKGDVEAILGPMEPEPAAGVLYEMPLAENRPAWLPLVNAGDVPQPGFVIDPTQVHPRWMEDRVAADLHPLESPNSLRRPVNFYTVYDCGFAVASPVKLETFAAGVFTALPVMAGPITLAMYPETRLTREVAPETPELDARPDEDPDPAPRCETLFTLSQPGAAWSVTAPAAPIGEIVNVMRVQLPLDAARWNATLAPASLLHAALHEIPLDRIATGPGSSIDSLRAVDFRVEVPQFILSTPPLRPRLRLAAGRRYTVRSRETAPAIASIDAPSYTAAPAALSLPDRRPNKVATAQNVPAAAAGQYEPNPAGLVPLSVTSKPCEFANAIHPAPPAMCLPQPPRPEPVRPGSRLEPIDAKPTADFFNSPEVPLVAPAARPAATQPEAEKAHLWAQSIDFWNRAPRDLKMLVFAIPVLLGLALHPSLPKVRVAAPAAASGFRTQFPERREPAVGEASGRRVLDRAAVALDEDFRPGLDDWVSRGDATTDWSFDATGFVRPGSLALYRPSMGLSDYQMQFLGMIDKKALSWVVRAADFDNLLRGQAGGAEAGTAADHRVDALRGDQRQGRCAGRYGGADRRSRPICCIACAWTYTATISRYPSRARWSIVWSEPRLRRGASASSARGARKAACAGCR